MAKELKTKLNTQPYKGARDFYPEDMRVRNYIFDTWKRVCKSYGYQEYDGPFLEEFELYRAKTGEEIVNEQLYWFEDKGGRKVAIRPETTPTLARMVAKKYKELPRPIKWFCIQNMWRYEKPQRGRLREFFQLNVDVFGVDGVEADFEVVSIAIDIMKAFGADESMFKIKIGNRRLLDDYFKILEIPDDKSVKLRKLIDKKSKISDVEFAESLKTDIGLGENQVNLLRKLFDKPDLALNELLLQGSIGAKEVSDLLNLMAVRGFDKFVVFDPTVVRGLDYYTGNVFEQFDLNPENNRAMYGGGRYDDLVSIFSGNKLTGTGFAMGDVTFLNFLEGWSLMPKLNPDVEYLVTLWPSEDLELQAKYFEASADIANQLRSKGKNAEMWLTPNTKIEKQLKYADTLNIKYVVIIGDTELKDNTITLKDMYDKTQNTISVSQL